MTLGLRLGSTAMGTLFGACTILNVYIFKSSAAPDGWALGDWTDFSDKIGNHVGLVLGYYYSSLLGTLSLSLVYEIRMMIETDVFFPIFLS